MIHYALVCEARHAFEGWFRSGADFDIQAERGLLTCPICGTSQVSRGLMAPALIGQARAPAGPEVRDQAPVAPDAASVPEIVATSAATVPPNRAVAGVAIPDALRALLSRVREDVERHCDDVGRDFADQALRMHHGDIARRGIYGQTTEAEREALADEGVEVGSIPWLPRTES